MGNQYPNIKMEIIDKIFGPIINYLDSKNITGFLVPLILSSIYVYFRIFKGRYKKGKELTLLDKICILAWIFIIIMTIVSQIIMIVKPWKR